MRRRININTGWAFQMDARLPDCFPAEWEQVNLPHTWNAQDGQDGGNDYRRGRGVYAKRLNLLPEAGQAVFLEVQGCNAVGEVYVNGALLCRHEGGYSTFRVELTDRLTGEDLLCIAADNGVSDRVYPQQADFTFYGGLYRDVNLILVPKTHFALTDDGAPGIRVRPVRRGNDYLVTVDSRQNGGAVAFAVNGETKIVPSCAGAAEASFEIKDAHLWDGICDPYLYTAKATLLDDDGTPLDEVSASFGCRSVRIDPQKGFFLNDRPYPLRGVSRHQDRKGLGNALSRQEHEEDLALILEMGANSVRLAHYQHDSYVYDLCDRYGLVVWAEIPYISAHMPGGRENTFSQMRELIVQCENHPSVAVWGLSNEITMSGIDDDLRENHLALNRLVKALDPTRPTVMANVMMLDADDPLNRLPDAVAYNIYFGWYVGELTDNDRFFDAFHKRCPDVAVGFSEYGCDTNPAYHSDAPVRGDYTEEYQLKYHAHILSLIEERPWLWCAYAWNMFDFAADAREEGGARGINQKGLVSFDRRLRKDAFYLYKAHWSQEPFVYLAGRRYVNRCEPVTEITVLTNQTEAALYVDDALLEKKTGRHAIRFEVPLAGEHRIRAVCGDLQDEIVIRRVQRPDPTYILQGGGILNWFDAGGLKSDCYSLKDRVCDLMRSGEAAAVVLGCVNRPGKDESAFILELRAHPQKLHDLELSMEQVLDRANPYISTNIKRHINAALQQIKREEFA